MINRAKIFTFFKRGGKWVTADHFPCLVQCVDFPLWLVLIGKTYPAGGLCSFEAVHSLRIETMGKALILKVLANDLL